MRWLIAGVALVMTTAFAHAQMTPQQTMDTAERIGKGAARGFDDKTPDASKTKANDKAYNAALKVLPDKRYDPWHGVR